MLNNIDVKKNKIDYMYIISKRFFIKIVFQKKDVYLKKKSLIIFGFIGLDILLYYMEVIVWGWGQELDVNINVEGI